MSHTLYIFIFKYIFDDFHFDGYVQLIIITNYQVIDNNQLHIVLSNWLLLKTINKCIVYYK